MAIFLLNKFAQVSGEWDTIGHVLFIFIFQLNEGCRLSFTSKIQASYFTYHIYYDLTAIISETCNIILDLISLCISTQYKGYNGTPPGVHCDTHNNHEITLF